MYCNIRSLQKNVSVLKFAVESIDYDLIQLTETWLSDLNDIEPILGQLLTAFNFARCDRALKRGGGVLILIKRSIAFNIVWRESIPDAFEIICCDLNLPQSTLRVIVVYRTPSCNLNDSIQLCKVLSDLCSFQGHSVITGDFNFPDIDWKENLPHGTSTVSQRFTEFCTSTKLVQKVREPTRGKHILDLVLCSQANLIKGVNVSASLGSSDHFCL